MMQFTRKSQAALTALVSASATALTACGAGSNASADSDEIRVGVITALSGPNASVGNEGRGVEAYFKALNDRGGINGHKVQVYMGNDQFNPALTPGVASKLVGQDHVQMMCGIAGSADAAAIKPFLAANKVPDVAPASGSSDLIKPPTPTEYEVVPSYEPLAASLVKYAVEKLHKSKIAIAYSSDDVGLPALAGVEWELKQLGLPLAAKVQFSLTATSLAPQAAQLKASGADFVILWHVAAPFALLVNNANQIGYHPTWGGGFFASTPSFVDLTKGTTDGNAYFASPFNSITAPESASYRAAMKKYESKVPVTDVNGMQGWSLADACAGLIKAATANGQPLSLDTITKAAEGFKLTDTYLHGLSWTSDSHSGLPQAQILKQQSGKFVPITPYETMPPAPTSAG